MNTAINTHLYLPVDLYTQISDLAREQNLPFARVARELMKDALKKKTKKKKVYKNPLDWLISFNIKGPKDLSINHDKYLYDEPYYSSNH
ncbi:hypothetical protein HY086_03845 [Candidatus Gottesmanbacteria bacterium]|nr:hypothetical protein [Candidatus Gottesmanbacteria bacterium]